VDQVGGGAEDLAAGGHGGRGGGQGECSWKKLDLHRIGRFQVFRTPVKPFACSIIIHPT